MTVASMLPLLVKASVVMAVAAVIAASMRRASAAARHAVWVVALVALLFLPALAYVLPRWEVRVLPPVPTAASTTKVAPVDVAVPDVPLDVTDNDADNAAVVHATALLVPSPAPARFGWSLVVVAAWWLGASFGLLHFALGTLLIALKTRRAALVVDEAWRQALAEAAQRIGVRRHVDLRTSDRIGVPMVWGIRRPVILIPSDSETWPAERRQAFLLHELAHVARHDCLTQTLAAIVHSLYWPHPLVWWALHRLRREAERACDDRVLAAGTLAPAYAHHLLEAARGLSDAPRTFAPASAVIERTSLGDRLLALLDDRLSRRTVAARTLALAGVGALALTGAVAALQPVARAAVTQAIHAAVEEASAAVAAPAPSAAATPVPAAAPRPSPRRALATAAPEAVLAGAVRAVGGKPIEKALVLAWEPQRLSEPALATRTDAAGEFKIAVPGPASYRIRVEAPSPYAPHTIEKIGTKGRIEITLVEGKTIEGIVRDAGTRRPLSKALVTAQQQGAMRPPAPSEPGAGEVSARSDKEGRYRLEGLAAGNHRVWAVAHGYGNSERGSAAPATGTDFFLHPGATISGLVKGADGKPAAGAAINAEGVAIGSRRPPVVSTDANGRFEIIGLEPGLYRVMAQHTAWAPGFVPEVSAHVGSTPPIEVRLEKAYRVIGRLAGADDRAVRGQVVLQATNGVEVPILLNQRSRSTAAADGRFTLMEVPPGVHTLGVVPVGYGSTQVEIAVGGKDEVVDIGDVKLEMGLAIRGKVRDAEGPIAAAVVSAGRSGDERTSAVSEADGSFVLAGLDKRTYRLSAEAEGHVNRADVEAEPGSGLEIVLEREARIVGTLVDDSGRPVSSGQVAARPVDSNRAQFPLPAYSDDVTSGGRFEIRRVRAPGPYVLEVQCDDYVDKAVSDVRVEVGRATDVGKIVLSAGGTIRGTVVDGSEAPVPGVVINTQSDRLSLYFGRVRQRRDAVSDGQGRFELRGLPEGRVEVQGRHRRYAASAKVPVDVDSAAGPSEIRLTLTEGGRVAGTARGRDGRPLAGAIAQVSVPKGAGNSAAVRSDGTFEVDRLTPGSGEARVLVGQGGFRQGTVKKDVEIREGETTHVDLALTDVLVSGRVTRGGRPLANHRVTFVSGGGSSGSYSGTGGMLFVPSARQGPERMSATTRPDGRYEMLVNAPGPYRVRVQPQGKERTGTPLGDATVPDVEAFTHDIALPDWALTGTVLAKEDGRPVPDARVELRPAGGEPGGASVMTDDDGRFRIAAEPGAYRVRVVAPKRVAHEEGLSVQGAAIERTFDLVRGGTLKGRVLAPDGLGADGATVVGLSTDGMSVRTARAVADGAFALEGLNTGSYQLFVGHRLGFASLTGAAVGADADLTLSPGARPRLRFRDEKGTPLRETPVRVDLVKVRDMRVGIRERASYFEAQHTDADGSFEMSLPLGRVEIVAWATDKRLVFEGPLDVLPQMVDATVVLKPPR